MKSLILSLALAALVAPCASAQAGGSTNSATVNAGNHQTGSHNFAANEFGLRQVGFARNKPQGERTFAPPAERSIGCAVTGICGPLFGNGPLVNNNISVATLVNVQTGANNDARNVAGVDQLIASRGPAAAGVLVNNNLNTITAVNVQTGDNNAAINEAGVSQGIFAGGRIPGLPR